MSNNPLIETVASAMREAVIYDDEGEFPRLFDLLGFSGENKTHTVTNALAQAAINAVRKFDLEYPPVAWMYKHENGFQCALHDRRHPGGGNGWTETPLYFIPAPEPKP